MKASFGRSIALAALVLAGTAAPGSAQTAETGFVAPSEPMRLTRVLERELGDGNAVIVTRSWRVRFVAQGDGYRIEGEEIAVTVDTPPRLAMLAEVEREKPDAGPFSITLDAAGLIVDERTASAEPIPGLAEAARTYLQRAPDKRRAEAMRYVMAVQQAGARMRSQWPEDLFYPAAPPRNARRMLALSGGNSGTISVSFDGTLAADGRHLATAQRHIVTTIGGDARASHESWRLDPIE